MYKKRRFTFPGLAKIQITDPTPSLSPKKRNQWANKSIFQSALETPIVDIDEIRENAWKGIPNEYRARVWRLFLDYEPLSLSSADLTLKQKRKDYFNCLERLYSNHQQAMWTTSQRSTIHQIKIDLPRTTNKLLHDQRVNTLFEHVLFVWAVRHPACGYVQGMNDILLPFFIVFIAPYFPNKSVAELCCIKSIEKISDEKLQEVEGDCYWCFSKLLDGIQDMFTKDQPGLFRMTAELGSIIKRVDSPLYACFKKNDVEIDQFAFPWMNCLLVRQFHLPMLLRIWDLYLSQVSKIASTHVYVCAAMVEALSSRIKQKPEDCAIFIQSLTPDYWEREDLETILAQAFVYEKTYSAPTEPRRSSFS